MAVTGPALARVARGLRLVRPAVWGRGPVRVWDRVEAVLILVLSVLLIGSVPVCWVVAAGVFAGERAADARIGLRYEVTGAVFPGVPVSHSAGAGGSPGGRQVRATWRAPDGTARGGDVAVELPSAGPLTVQIWVDRHGTPQTAPRTSADLLFVAVINGLAAEFGCVAAAVLVYSVGRLTLDRRRARGWDEDWRRLTGAGTDSRR